MKKEARSIGTALWVEKFIASSYVPSVRFINLSNAELLFSQEEKKGKSDFPAISQHYTPILYILGKLR